MSSHLEELLSQYFEWKGYIVKRNVLVGRRKNGGWECELDIVAYHPQSEVLLHLEPSLDAHPWPKREIRYKKKFSAGRKYIFKDVFPWLSRKTQLRQIAIFVRSRPSASIAGGEIKTVDEMVGIIRRDIEEQGVKQKAAIPEQYGLLRTIQLTVNGYARTMAVS